MSSARRLSFARRSRMRFVQVSSMQDLCIHLVPTTIQSSRGEEVTTFAAPPTNAVHVCGYENVSSTDVGPDEEELQFDARLRLPLDVEGVIQSNHRIQLIERYNEVLADPPVFEIVGGVVPGASAIVVNLRRVTP